MNQGGDTHLLFEAHVEQTVGLVKNQNLKKKEDWDQTPQAKRNCSTPLCSHPPLSIVLRPSPHTNL